MHVSDSRKKKRDATKRKRNDALANYGIVSYDDELDHSEEHDASDIDSHHDTLDDQDFVADVDYMYDHHDTFGEFFDHRFRSFGEASHWQGGLFEEDKKHSVDLSKKVLAGVCGLATGLSVLMLAGFLLTIATMHDSELLMPRIVSSIVSFVSAVLFLIMFLASARRPVKPIAQRRKWWRTLLALGFLALSCAFARWLAGDIAVVIASDDAARDALSLILPAAVFLTSFIAFVLVVNDVSTLIFIGKEKKKFIASGQPVEHIRLRGINGISNLNAKVLILTFVGLLIGIACVVAVGYETIMENPKAQSVLMGTRFYSESQSISEEERQRIIEESRQKALENREQSKGNLNSTNQRATSNDVSGGSQDSQRELTPQERQEQAMAQRRAAAEQRVNQNATSEKIAESSDDRASGADNTGKSEQSDS